VTIKHTGRALTVGPVTELLKSTFPDENAGLFPGYFVALLKCGCFSFSDIFSLALPALQVSLMLIVYFPCLRALFPQASSSVSLLWRDSSPAV
jgi:hypothetical protein